jgi:hypothetical protein
MNRGQHANEPQRVARALAAHLRAKETEDAARLFVQAHQRGAFARYPDLLHFLVRKLGRRRSGQLVDALARFRCYNCLKGYVPCEDCKGEGRVDHETICERCVGLGVQPCEFCAGSGLTGIEILPAQFHALVATDRIKRCSKRLKDHVRCSLPVVEQDGVEKGVQGCTKLLLSLERRVRALTNAMGFVRQLVRSNPKLSRKLETSRYLSPRLAAVAEQRIQECVRQLVSGAIIEAQQAPKDSKEKRLAESRIALYQRLLGSKGFQGTRFDRISLTEAISAAP